MSIYFGSVFYFSEPLGERPDAVVAALSGIASVDEPFSVQASFTGTDKWTRRRRVSPTSLRQLQVDIGAGVFDQVIAYQGERGHETATLSIDCFAAGPVLRVPEVTLSLWLEGDSELERAEAIAHNLWVALRPAYGISTLGQSLHDVMSELSLIPISVLGSADDPGNQQRLQRLHAARRTFGEFSREASWGNYLGPRLVSELGDPEAVVANAPAGYAEILKESSGVYLRVARDVRVEPISKYRPAVARLTKYLLPVLSPSLRSVVKS